MARKKNATYQGAPIPEVTRDASIYARTVANVAGDAALIFDKITGENGHAAADTINHSGSGRGCWLRMPLVNQFIDRSMVLATGSDEVEYIVCAVPVYVHANAAYNFLVGIDLVTPKTDTVSVEVRSLTWALVSGPVTATVAAGTFGPVESITMQATVSMTSAAWQYVVVRRKLYITDSSRLLNLRVYPAQIPPGDSIGGSSIPTSSAVGNPFPADATMVPATGSVATGDGIDTIMLGNDYPLDAYVMTRANRLIGTMYEFLTGAKIPGNNSITCATTRNNNRASFTAEPLIEFPVMSCAMTAFPSATVTTAKDHLNTIAAPTNGPLDLTRGPQTNATLAAPHFISRTRVYLPPFRTGASADLKGMILLCGYTGSNLATNWRFAFDVGGNLSAYTAPVVVDAVNAPRLYAVTIPALNFTAGAANEVIIKCYSGAASFTEPFVMVGWGLAYCPP